ncbi:MAG: hypothetical protein CL932_16530 [Deltaproteobacteria bacterium]|nr:hypothetical protein [Deltaproteobacteria bacterium]|tara:strand:- start:14679 stop:16577 length:1899 start_codon:yes stop_codon:yes gene_type:complete
MKKDKGKAARTLREQDVMDVQKGTALTEIEVSAVSELDLELEPDEATLVQHEDVEEHTAVTKVVKEVQAHETGSPFERILAPKRPDPNAFEGTENTIRLHTENDDRFLHITKDKGAEEPRYKDLGHLARGGMSEIRCVFDQNLMRRVVTKVLPTKISQTPGGIQRFIEEAQITGQLEHPNIVPVYDLGMDEQGQLYFTMKRVKGKTLKQLLNPLHYDPGAETDLYHALQIFLKVCDAVAFAHSKGVLHRDLKPSNVMIGRFGEVYLMDWGVAAVSGQRDRLLASHASEGPTGQIHLQRDPEFETLDIPGAVIGSLSYLSPEQARGDVEQIDERTDIFSLGGILYQILTLQPPYTGKNHKRLIQSAQACEIPSPHELTSYVHLPRTLCEITMKALSKDPKERFQSVMQLKEALEFFLQGDGRFPRKNFPKGATLLQEGDRGYVAYGLIRGRCEVSRMVDGRKVVLRTMGPGEVFGEMALLSAEFRTATVEAIDDITVMMIHKETLEQEVGLDSWMGRLVSNLCERFNEVDQKLIQYQREAHRAWLLNTILSSFHIYGEKLDTKESLMSWSMLQDTLCEQSELDVEEIVEECRALPFLHIEPEKDHIYLSPSRLLQWQDVFQPGLRTKIAKVPL